MTLATYPHENNACSGRFSDWLEVNLTSCCNAKCSWCVERRGWHPQNTTNLETLVEAAIGTGKTDVILLGGEPTLYPDLQELTAKLRGASRRVWVTTNGSRLSAEWATTNLQGVFGVNVSLHHYNLEANRKITGLSLDYDVLRQGIESLHNLGSTVRLNCNCISGMIDSELQIRHFITFATELGADCVRFAELKHDAELFVDLAKVFNSAYGLNDDPFQHGCSTDTVIYGVPVNFRQMCGFQTKLRPQPTNPVFPTLKQVLYYDGKLYDGWQTLPKELEMNDDDLQDLLQDVAKGKMTPEEAKKILLKSVQLEQKKSADHTLDGGYCQY